MFHEQWQQLEGEAQGNSATGNGCNCSYEIAVFGQIRQGSASFQCALAVPVARSSGNKALRLARQVQPSYAVDIMAKLKVLIVPVTPFQQNCALVFNEETLQGAVVDPGGNVPQILKAIEQAGISVEKILLTHGHIDHAGGAAELRDALGVKIAGPHKDDLFLLKDLPMSGAKFGIADARAVEPDRWLEDGDQVNVADLSFAISHAPGHSPGSVVFFNRENRFAFMGDVLFRGSVGRTDFPYGSEKTLLASIRDKILPLGDDVVFLPGHGSASEIGIERTTNPFIQSL
jgi:hydroxyacylglutathione hydrolase